jgi:hypothetical protein
MFKTWQASNRVLMKTRRASPSEAAIQKGVLNYLKLRQIPHWRMNVIGVPLQDGTFRPNSMAGFADILAMFQGTAVALEVKTDKGRQTEKQKEFQKEFERGGGIYHVVRNVEQVHEIIKTFEARK